MAEVLSVRLNEPSNPNREKDFADALDISGASSTKVVRELVDAYVRFVKKNERLPRFPFEIIEGAKKKQAPSPR